MSKEQPVTPDDTFSINNNGSLIALRIEGLDPQDILTNKWFTTEVYMRQNIKHDENGDLISLRQNLSFMNCTEIETQFSGARFFEELDSLFYLQNLCINFTVDNSINTNSTKSTQTNTEYVNFPMKADKNKEVLIKLTCGRKNAEGVNCLHDPKLKKKFSRKNFYLTFLDSTPDFDNVKNPFYQFIDRDFMYVNPYLGKFMDLTYSNTAVESDFGIVLESFETKRGLQINRLMHNYMINTQDEHYDVNDVNIIQVNIRFSDNMKLHKRMYYKMQMVFAEVGGILNGILLLGKLLVSIFSKSFFHESMINDIFHNYLEKDENEEKGCERGGDRKCAIAELNISRRAKRLHEVSGGTSKRFNRVNDSDRREISNCENEDNFKYKNKKRKERRDKSGTKERGVDYNYPLNGEANFSKSRSNNDFGKSGRQSDVNFGGANKDPKSKSPGKVGINANGNKIFHDISLNYSITKEPNLNVSNKSNNLLLNDNEKMNNIIHDNIIPDNTNLDNTNLDNTNQGIIVGRTTKNKLSSLNENKNQHLIKLKSPEIKTLELINNNPQKNSSTNKNEKTKNNNSIAFISKENTERLKIQNNQQKTKHEYKNIKLSSKGHIETNIHKSNNENLQIDKDKKQQKEAFKPIMEKKVNISMKSILMTMLCPHKFHSEETKKNHAAYNKFFEKLQKNLELDYLLNANKNIELIKTLYLNKKQRIALKYVKFGFADDCEDVDMQKEIEVVRQYFLKRQGAFDSKDIKILEVLNNEIFRFDFL